MMILWYNAEVISNPLTVLKSLIKTFFYKWFYWEMDLLLIIIEVGLTELLFIWQEVQMNDDETALNLLYNQVFYTII